VVQQREATLSVAEKNSTLIMRFGAGLEKSRASQILEFSRRLFRPYATTFNNCGF
jgi:hypothetical protein